MKKQTSVASISQIRWATPLQILATVFLIFLAGPLLAANRTWITSPSDALWSNAGNWGGTAPIANADAVLFNDSTITNLNDDLGVNFALIGITFNSTTNSSYVVTNNAIALNGGITDNSTQSQALNVSLLLTNGTKTISIVQGGNLIIGGVIGNYPLAGQNNGITLSQVITAPNQFISGAGFDYTAPATLTLNSATPNTFTNTTTLNAGTVLVLDFANMATPVNLLSTNAVSMNGATYSLKGKSSGSTFQTNAGNGTITFGTGGNIVTLNPNGGAGTTLKLGSTWTRNSPATLNVDISAGGTVAANPALGNGLLGYATVKDSTGTSFATTNSSGAIVRYTATTALDSAANSAVTNFSVAGSLTINAVSFGVNSLTLDATGGNGVLDLGGAGDVMTNTSKGILMIGANNFTIKNGVLNTNNGETIIHQMGSGTLTNLATIGGGTSFLTKNGNGALVLASASTNSGTSVINRGLVKLGIPSAPGSGPFGNSTNGLTINAGGSLDLNGNSLTLGAYNANGIAVITNSVGGAPAVFTIGNGNGPIAGYNSTFFSGNLTLKVTGSSSANFNNLANTHTGGTIYQGNNLGDRVINPTSFGSGSVIFNGSGGFTIPSAGLTAWANVGGFTNPIVVNSSGNVWNFQNNSAGNTVRSEGAWMGSGTLTMNNGFSPNFNWAGDISAFAGNLILQGSSGQTVRYTMGYVNTNIMGGSAGTVFDLQSLTTGNLNFQYDNTNTPATIRLGDLNTTGNTGTGIIIVRDNIINTAVTFEVGALNASSTFGGSIQDFAAGSSISITKVGTGTWTLNGTANGGNTYSGATTISNGVLAVNSNLGGSGVNVFSPGGLGGSGTVSSLVTLNAGNAGLLLTNNSGGTLTLSGGLTLSNANVLAFDLGSVSDQVAITGGTFTQVGTATIYIAQVSGFGAGTYNLVTGASGINSANFTLGNSAPGYSLMLTNPDAATLALVVTVAAPATAFWHNRAGTIWNAANNWDTNASGNVALLTPPSIPTDVTFAANAANNYSTTLGADFSIHTLTLSTPNNVSIGGANTLTISAGLTNDTTAANNVINAKVILGTDQQWVNNSANSLVVNSNISGAHSLTVIAGSTNILLNGQNTYSGGTIINSGTLTLGHPTDTLANSGAVIVNGGNLDIGANSDTVGAVAITNGNLTGTSGTLMASSFYAENGNLTANLASSGGFIKNTGGTVLLAGTNAYTGATLVSGGGTLQLGNNAALGNSSGITVNGGSTLDANGFNVTRPIISISGGSILANNSINPSVITTDWANGNQAFTIGGSGDLTVPSMSGTAAWTVTQNNSGTVTYAGNADNPFMGLIVNNGTAVLAKPLASTGHVVGGNISSGSDLVLNNGTVKIALGGNGDQLFNVRTITVNSGLFDLNGQSEQVDGINGTGGQVTNSAASTSTLTLGFAGGNGNQTFAGTIDGPTAIVKAGTGIQTLSGICTYTGNTTVSGGTLALLEPGSIGGSATINITSGNTLDVTGRSDQTLTLNSGQTLMGNGSINGNLVTLSGSTVSPGASVGTLQVTNNITLGGKLLVELNRTNTQTFDRLVSVLGTITYGGTLSVTNIGPALTVTNTFQLFPSAVTTFSSISLATNDATGNIYTWTNRIAIDGSIALLTVVSPVNTNPTNVTAIVNGGNLELNWPADHIGWHLQAQTNSLATGLGTNWVSIPGTDANNHYTNTIDATKGTVFYRLVYP